MANNVYDVAYNLETAVKESDEFKNLQSLYKEVFADDTTKRMFENFRNIQLELQQKQMSGQEITQEEVEQAQKTVAVVQQNEAIAKLMEAEQQMSMMVSELNKIIMKPLEELYSNVDSAN
ncbi:YlbF family regulator [Sutcliffiella horikoshii]|uniref:YlbF family regulator n=1 Tax=Sutcliffiella horikoshii TaxID=79883 RepID=UPI001F261F93|nr:YlbF family regulator [Sutcliffiella horikoshii]MCG1022469.1 YlbF family regulator [Sutcliffiella horikoshii]